MKTLMSKTARVVVGLVAVALTASCAKFNQDPLKGYPDSVRNGVKPDERQPKPDRKPISKEGYRLIYKGAMDFTVGQEVTHELSAEVYEEVESFDVVFDNLSSFAGATFEEVEVLPPPPDAPRIKKYKLTWTAPIGVTGDSTVATLPMLFKFVVQDEIITVTPEAATAIVNRDFSTPKITAMAFAATKVQEGTPVRLNIDVEDKDASDTRPPQIRFEKPSFGKDGSQYLYFVDVKKDAGTGIWKFTYELDTGSRDVTDSSEYFYVNAVAVSRFGKQSPQLSKSVELHNRVLDPRVSLTNNTKYVFAVGALNTISFNVYDKDEDGEVTAKAITDLKTFPGTASLTCKRVSSFEMNCDFTWMIPVGTQTKKNYTLIIESVNKGTTGWWSNLEKKVRHTLNIEISGPGPFLPASEDLTPAESEESVGGEP